MGIGCQSAICGRGHSIPASGSIPLSKDTPVAWYDVSIALLHVHVYMTTNVTKSGRRLISALSERIIGEILIAE